MRRVDPDEHLQQSFEQLLRTVNLDEDGSGIKVIEMDACLQFIKKLSQSEASLALKENILTQLSSGLVENLASNNSKYKSEVSTVKLKTLELSAALEEAKQALLPTLEAVIAWVPQERERLSVDKRWQLDMFNKHLIKFVFGEAKDADVRYLVLSYQKLFGQDPKAMPVKLRDSFPQIVKEMLLEKIDARSSHNDANSLAKFKKAMKGIRAADREDHAVIQSMETELNAYIVEKNSAEMSEEQRALQDHRRQGRHAPAAPIIPPRTSSQGVFGKKIDVADAAPASSAPVKNDEAPVERDRSVLIRHGLKKK